ncbi:hypothetical protein BCR35DRAFT_349900 [Leucosporidium creatinivorum]|uniref:Uncharacterized protein n=1 Tax=Leucosporidium creatinivorum TaxID=106004 RepID=A0A1Y2G4G6_9BASI|nr:hypothetical protein BCR35DRAFT_349900 [Leucosporidium creatinivorum]
MQEWIPNGDKHAGMIGVGVCACLSFLSMLLLLAYCISLLYTHYRRSPLSIAEEGSTRAVRFLTSSPGVLFLNLIVGDSTHCIGFMMTFEWLHLRAMPSPPTLTCQLQSVFIQLGNIAIAFANTYIAVSVFCLVVFSYKLPPRLVAALIGVQWIAVAVMALVGPVWISRGGGPFYAIAGGWCWITPEYDLMWLMLHHMWVYIAAFINLVLYSIVAYTILSRRRRAGGEQGGSAGLAMTLVLYPVAYCVVVTPLASYRLATLVHRPWPIQAGLAAGAVLSLAGFVDCLIFACTRALFSKKTGGRAVGVGTTEKRTRTAPRKGGGSTIGGGTPRNWEARPRFSPKLPSTYLTIHGLAIDSDTDLAFAHTTSRLGHGGGRSVSFVSSDESESAEEGATAAAAAAAGRVAEGDGRCRLCRDIWV